MYKKIFTLILCINSFFALCQIPSYRLTDWTKAGLLNPIYNHKNIVTIESFGGSAINNFINDTAIVKAIDFLKANGGGTIQFGNGLYFFSKPIFLSDSITLKGNSSRTILSFNLGGKAQNCINILGNIKPTKYPFETAKRGSKFLKNIENKFPTKNAIIQLFQIDSSLAFSNWAYGAIGQICKVKNIDTANKTIELLTPLRLNFNKDLFYKEITPIQNVSIECLAIERKDSTASQTKNILFNYAFNCRVKGVELIDCNFAHINFENSIHNEVIQSYIHKAFAYGGGGQGYGVVMQATSSDNKIENNIFERLRHSILLQSGSNGNVIGYNYSWDTYWESFPENAAGDLVCHGNYAHSNLFEGNICQNIVVDNSHGKNGPYNTFFRNRAELYGIVTNAQDSQNYIANEVTNTTLFMGQYIVGGVGNLAIKNNIKGTLQSSNLLVNESSLYLAKKPFFFNQNEPFPVFGYPVAYNTNKLPARERYIINNETILCNTFTTNLPSLQNLNLNGFKAYPNPFNSSIKIESKEEIYTIALYNLEGKKIACKLENNSIDLAHLPCGIYCLKINNFAPQMIVKN